MDQIADCIRNNDRWKIVSLSLNPPMGWVGEVG
jgi:hypothetical protein